MTDPATYPIEIQAPDITPYKDGNTGIDYATSFDSGRSGPHVMVTAVVHGNEICGAIALELFGAPRLTEKERNYRAKGLLGW